MIDSQNTLNNEYATNKQKIADGLATVDAAQEELNTQKAKLEEADAYMPMIEAAVRTIGVTQKEKGKTKVTGVTQ